VAELRSLAKGAGVGAPGPYGAVSPYEYLDVCGYVTVLCKEIGHDAVPGLVEMLGDPDDGVRYVAVIALARIGLRAADAVPALIRHFEEEPDVEVRANIVDALRLIDPASAKALGWG
jgi:HEAT repeat protein